MLHVLRIHVLLLLQLVLLHVHLLRLDDLDVRRLLLMVALLLLHLTEHLHLDRDELRVLRRRRLDADTLHWRLVDLEAEAVEAIALDEVDEPRVARLRRGAHDS